jgi:hypothetical protein
VSAKKCRRCDECATEKHHLLPLEDYAEEYPEHAAAKAGHHAWYACKHCPAYLPVTDEVMDVLDAEADVSKHVVVPEVP